jgi:hypothetical protein
MQALRRVLPSLRRGLPQDGRLIRKNKSPVPRSVTWVPAHGFSYEKAYARFPREIWKVAQRKLAMIEAAAVLQAEHILRRRMRWILEEV